MIDEANSAAKIKIFISEAEDSIIFSFSAFLKTQKILT
jgi:hypothetical protein